MELEALPDSIGNMASLKTIYIMGGKMTALPDSTGNISSLVSIQLQYTNVTRLPGSIGNLTKLENLGIYGSQNDTPRWEAFDMYPDYYQDEKTEKRSPFTGLPDTAAKLQSLKFLNLSNTEVRSLPGYLGALPALEKIDISGCDITTVPPSIQKLINSGELTLIKSADELWEYHHSFERKRPRRS